MKVLTVLVWHSVKVLIKSSSRTPESWSGSFQDPVEVKSKPRTLWGFLSNPILGVFKEWDQELSWSPWRFRLSRIPGTYESFEWVQYQDFIWFWSVPTVEACGGKLFKTNFRIMWMLWSSPVSLPLEGLMKSSPSSDCTHCWQYVRVLITPPTDSMLGFWSHPLPTAC